ncbi:hypothetical protein MS_051 [Vibrio phage VPMS1]|uniref:hypothetical protein n=1 Tax=Vibrio phage VPMS1 TaxID=1233488 RepID=UPI0003584817|nr:hypothetical protein MS_051 [Vibrio phage VPMS1]AFV51130.1 hypothetical protein MS_051 [Vibrio phage VPMS1]
MHKWCYEDFDYEYQCWVILAIADSKSEAKSLGDCNMGEGYDSQGTTRLRPIYKRVILSYAL